MEEKKSRQVTSSNLFMDYNDSINSDYIRFNNM